MRSRALSRPQSRDPHLYTVAMRREAVASVSVTDRIRETVVPDEGRLPMFVYADPDVYDLELQRVFGRSWLFVAHESEIPEPGSWVQRTMGEQSVIVARGEDGVIRTFLNSCRHRGMKLACEDFGQCKMWRCPYHGFAYASTGEFMGTLVGAPFERMAYPGGLDRDALHLIEARCRALRRPRLRHVGPRRPVARGIPRTDVAGTSTSSWAALRWRSSGCRRSG